MRVLVTGSRDWTDEETLRDVFAEIILYHLLDENVVLVSGNCPTGADKMAEDAFEEWGRSIEKHPADWDKFGKRAGYLRNKEMVDSKPDLCVAFIKNNSRGASMTLDLAQKAGIQTSVYRQDDELTNN